MTTEAPRRRHTYRGVTPAARDAARRKALQQAALELFGTRGWGQATVTALCREAGVTTRTFYELYRDREELFLTVYDEITRAGMERIATAAVDGDDAELRLRAGVRAAVDYYSDARRARIVFMEIFGRGAKPEQHRHQAMEDSAAMAEGVLTALAKPGTRARRVRLIAIALVGAFSELMVTRVATGTPTEPEIVRTLTDIFASAVNT
jgi:AcrR family transcriptional regulator